MESDGKQVNNKLNLKDDENDIVRKKSRTEINRVQSIGKITLKDWDFMSVDELIALDKRSFCTFYWNTIYVRHDILRGFIYKTSLNPFYIRIPIFFTAVSIAFALNAIFYSDEYISQKNDIVLDGNYVIKYLSF